jgi:hypothetical protein
VNGLPSIGASASSVSMPASCGSGPGGSQNEPERVVTHTCSRGHAGLLGEQGEPVSARGE